MRELIPKERLLELHVGDGWGPLCEFLGISVPDMPYPHSNDSGTFQKRHQLGKSLLLQLVGLVSVFGWTLTMSMKGLNRFLQGQTLTLSTIIAMPLCVSSSLYAAHIYKQAPKWVLAYHGTRSDITKS